MRTVLIAVLLWLAAQSSPGFAQDLVLKVDPAALIEVEINGQKIMLEVDPRLPDVIVLNPATARDLTIQTVPFSRAAVAIDNAVVTGRIGRPKIVHANGKADRSFALIFDYPITSRAGGSIGPGSLPWNRITLQLGETPPDARIRTFALKDPDYWQFPVRLADMIETRVSFDVVNPDTIFNRLASGKLEEAGLIRSNGELAATPFVLGLTTRMQPILLDPSISLEGLTLDSVFARTASPIVAETDSTIVIREDSKSDRNPGVIVGLASLRGCTSISVDRKAKTLSLACDR